MAQRERVLNEVWNTSTLAWERMSQPVISTDTLAVSLTGVATAANQSTGNTSLSNIDAKLKTEVPATATRTQVADSATDVVILAANSSRIGAIIYNDSTAVLYLGLGTTATTTTNYTIQMAANSSYEIPFGFTGQIRGIWASDPNAGAARVTEITA